MHSCQLIEMKMRDILKFSFVRQLGSWWSAVSALSGAEGAGAEPRNFLSDFAHSVRTLVNDILKHLV